MAVTWPKGETDTAALSAVSVEAAARAAADILKQDAATAATDAELTAESVARIAADLLKQDAATAATDTELATGLSGKASTASVTAIDSRVAAVEGTVVPLPAASGTDDTAALNAALAANAGRTLRGRTDATYKISAPLIVDSGTALVMETCTVQLKAGSDCNMLQNRAVAPAATGSDAAVSSGSNVVTTAVSAQVGQTAIIVGAGGNGTGPLVGNITAVGGGTITLKTLDGRNANASATVSGAAIKVYNRDSNISIIGGTWDRGNNAGTGVGLHSLLLRHIDGLHVDIERYESTGGKYGVAPGDITNFSISVRDSNTSSTGFQMNGPAWNGEIPHIGGTAVDDLCPLTAGDYVTYQDTAGDIIGVHIGTVAGVSTGANLLKLLAGNGRLIDGITVDHVSGDAELNGVWIGDDAGQSSTTAGNYGTIDIGMVAATVGSGAYPVNIISPAAEHIRVKLSHRDANSTRPGVAVTGTTTRTIGRLTVEGNVTGPTAPAVQVNSTTVTVSELDVAGLVFNPTAAATMVDIHNGIVRDLTLDRCVAVGLASGSGIVLINSAGATLDRVKVLGGTYSNGNTFFSGLGSGATQLTLVGCDIASVSRVATAAGALTVILNGPTLRSISSAAFHANGGSVTVTGGGLYTSGTFTLVSRAASEALRVNGPTLAADVGLLTPSTGDVCLNTDSADAAAVVVMWDGAKWQPIGVFPEQIRINPATPSAKTGTWSVQVATSLPFNFHYLSNAQNDQVTYPVLLQAGTWKLAIMGSFGTSRGIYTIALDGVTVGTLDAYNAGGGFGTLELTGITVAKTGVKLLTLTMATKNASSSNYLASSSELVFTKTA
jgi:hypothetical protein